MAYGISLYNSQGQQFYDSSTSGSYMTLTKTFDISMSRRLSLVDTGVPSNTSCLCFMRDISSGGPGVDVHGLQIEHGGMWHIKGSANVDHGGVLRVYVFSTLTPPKTASYSYGVEIYNSAGQLILHNTAKPLTCTTATIWGGGAQFSHTVAITGSMLGFKNDPYRGPQQVFTTCQGSNAFVVEREGGPYDDVPYGHTTIYAIDVSKYE